MMNLAQISPILGTLQTIEADPFQEAAYVASQAKAYTAQLQAGTLSAAECADLLKDLTWDQSAATTAAELETLTALSNSLDSLISLVSAIR